MKKTLCTALILATLPLAGLLTGCASTARPDASANLATASSSPATGSRAEQVVIQGELTDNGLGCPALRTTDGTLYTLARELEGSKKGASIRVEGYVVPSRGCAVGVSVMPQRAVVVTAPAAATSVASTLVVGDRR